MEIVLSNHIQPEMYQPDDDISLVTIFRHNLWANLELVSVCRKLTDGQIQESVEGTYGPIYETVKHLAGAEQGYLNLITLRRQGTSLGWEERPSLTTLAGYIRNSGEGLISAAAITEGADIINITYTNGEIYPIPASLLFTQAINHAGEHRTQIMTILTQIGIEPPDLSAWTYVENYISPTT